MAFAFLLEPPVLQDADEIGNGTMVEAPLALLDEEVEVLLGNAVVVRSRDGLHGAGV